MTRKTVLNDTHRALGARMVDFGGWDMPLNYGSQIEEHHAVRRDAGMFDVSHMTVVDLHGPRTREFLRRLLANNVDKLKKAGKALYSCMLNERGGVIDDLIVYFLADDFFRVIVNAATRDKDLAWINTHAAPFGVAVTERSDLAMIAVQGPQARDKMLGLLSPATREGVAAIGKFVAAEAEGPDAIRLFIAQPAPAWSISAAGTCRSTMARRSRSTMPCARTAACSMSRTCAPSMSSALTPRPSCAGWWPTTSTS